MNAPSEKSSAEILKRLFPQKHLKAVSGWDDNSYCTETGQPTAFCSCTQCRGEDYEYPETDTAPETMPTAFPAAPAVPEICKRSYYGIQCDNPRCTDKVHDGERRRR